MSGPRLVLAALLALVTVAIAAGSIVSAWMRADFWRSGAVVTAVGVTGALGVLCVYVVGRRGWATVIGGAIAATATFVGSCSSASLGGRARRLTDSAAYRT
jgi:hypothetical protein